MPIYACTNVIKQNTTMTDNLSQEQHAAANDYKITVDRVQYCVHECYYCYNNKQVASTERCQILIFYHQIINKTGDAER